MAPSIHSPLPLPSLPDHLPHLASPLGLTYLVVLTTILLSFYVAVSSFHAIYLHPLARVPGPKSWIAFPILPLLYNLAGTMDAHILKLHQKHGSVLRISRDELTFTTAKAWNDVYGMGVRPQLPKPYRREPGKVHSIINANDKDHARFRKALSHGFSERALREQEGLIKSYVDLLVEKLRGVAKAGGEADMVKWYNYTTFDIIGDLSFGQSFDCLVTTAYHHWVRNILPMLLSTPLMRGMFTHPLIFKPLAFFKVPKSVRNSRDYQQNLVRERLQTRINNESQQGRCDFVDSMLKHQGDSDETSFDEMAMTANVVVIAGSETTATLMSGVTWYLCKNPTVYEKVKEEVRERFKKEEEITFASVTDCKYMLAVLEEGMRMYPPAPSMFCREALEDMEVDGVPVPKGTHVSVHQLAAYRSGENWTQPSEFLPERWTKEGEEGVFRDDNRAVLQPFHVGPRNCLGRNLALAEMRLILARMLWNFDIELCAESDSWINQKIKTLWIKPPLMCKVKIRHGLGKTG